MISIITSMLSGILLGYFLRQRRLRFVQPCITLFIWLLLLLMGIEVGTNEVILSNLPTLGAEALLLTIGGLLGSCTAAWFLWREIKKKEGKNNSSSRENNSVLPDASDGNPLKSSLIIVAFFVLGVLLGDFCHFPFNISEYGISFYVLYGLMFSVGVSIGSDPQVWERFRSLSFHMMLLPILTIIGTLAGTFFVAFILRERSLGDYLAIGSGFGYYSLSSILITEMRGAELGTIALLANIARELITMLGAPLLLRIFGTLAPISAGGATSMDSTLPIILRTGGNNLVVPSLFHGFWVDFSVPFLVTLFCSL